MSQDISVGHSASSPRAATWKARDLKRVRRFAWGLVLLLSAAALAVGLAIWSHRPAGRVANHTLRLSWSPPSDTAWNTENAYPHLKFFEPTCVAFAADGSGRAFVLERRGLVQLFRNDSQASQCATVLDISDHVWRTPYEDDGAVAIALHPEFGQDDSANKDYFYLLYTAKIVGRRYDRLSRFTLRDEQAGDELVLIDQLDENLWHNGGGLAFGPEGFLYVGVGDEGTDGDGLENGQRLDRDLFCGILRIDVDRRGGDVSHPPRRQPDTAKTAAYFIPADNPFVGVPGVLEEFWAHGLRNPFRIAFDRKSGRLWAADVGHLRREEINIIRAGGNYGWSYREGTLPFAESYLQGQRPNDSLGEEVDPVWEYPHLNGNNCIIGGFVYRGEKHPQLQGKYIYADNGSGRVWALTHDDDQATTNEELLSLPVSAKTGIASVQPDADGEPLIVILGKSGTTGGTIHRIVPAEKQTSSSLPSRLSETGIFASLNPLSPNPGVIAYEVNAPQSAGAARIRRWLALPGDGLDPDPSTDRIEFSQNGSWKFPSGAVFVQHFDLPVVQSSGQSWRPIETRILVRHWGSGVYALSYRWNDEGTDARLVRESDLVPMSVRDTAGKTRHQSWQFLDRQTCLACHNANAGFILGVNARQLHRASTHGRSNEQHSQLLQLSRDGYFHQPFDEAQVSMLSTLVAPNDETADLDRRARSYLDVNCAACHREGGARSNYFAQFHRTADAAALQTKPLQGEFGIADAKIITPGDPFRSVLYYRMAKLGQGRMPLVGAHELDREGLSLLRQWIERMEPAGGALRHNVDTEGEIESLLSNTRDAFALWQAIHDGALAHPRRSQIIARARAHESSAVRDLYEWFVDPIERTQRLGTNFDPLLVLQHEGNADRGRALYSNADLVSCRKCHSPRADQPAIGPTLVGIGKKFTCQELLLHIADPSLRIDPQYLTWMVETSSGRLRRGVLVQRSEDEVTLTDEHGNEHRIRTADIELMEQQPRSLMPDHLLQSLTPAQAADLLAYLNTL